MGPVHINLKKKTKISDIESSIIEIKKNVNSCKWVGINNFLRNWYAE